MVFLVKAAATYDFEKNPFTMGHFGLSNCRIIFDSRPYPYGEDESSMTMDVASSDEVRTILLYNE
ncbi:MAG: hypothetical protein GY847_09325 [Proteobacteria bacterium]|nr:hypothetical protein [Pseudomonadota bacterium]